VLSALCAARFPLSIINDILDFSKIDSGNLKLERSMHSLIDAVETAVLLCHDAASTKGLDLHYWVQPDAPHAFFVDASRLQQILLNLLSNGQHQCSSQTATEIWTRDGGDAHRALSVGISR